MQQVVIESHSAGGATASILESIDYYNAQVGKDLLSVTIPSLTAAADPVG